MSYPLEYILEQLDRGFSLEFIARDAGVQIKSLARRLDRAKKNGKLEKRYINILEKIGGNQ
jgi:AraC-like DNA-binding protein